LSSDSQQTAFAIVDGRYVLTNDPVRHGGMSTVSKAFDPQSSRFCAIKRMKGGGGDDVRWKDSFNREYAALRAFATSEHRRVAGRGIRRRWILHGVGMGPGNLVDLIGKGGPLEWREFYHSIGRPILDALVYAQNRGWNHRDIKPQNILIGDDGVSKLSD